MGAKKLLLLLHPSILCKPYCSDPYLLFSLFVLVPPGKVVTIGDSPHQLYIPSQVFDGNISYTDLSHIANEFYDYFANVGGKLTEKMVDTEVSPI